jgi:hypothetical protein
MQARGIKLAINKEQKLVKEEYSVFSQQCEMYDEKNS